MKILIAEDEILNFEFLSVLLEDFCMKDECVSTILHAKNGQEAIDLCFSNLDIRFVLMDIRMPVLNGMEAIVEIRKKLPNLPIIVQTAFAFDNEKEKILESGATDIINKPVFEEVLFPLLKNILL